MRLPFALLALALFACSSDDDASLALGAASGASGAGGGGTGAVCVAGKQESCPCLDGLGVQRCRDDGRGYDACACPGGGGSGAGTSGIAGAGGSGNGGSSNGGSSNGGSSSGGKGGAGATSGAGAGGGSGSGSACQGGSIDDVVRLPSDVLLLLDKSGSMSEGPGNVGAPKWASLPAGVDKGLGASDSGARVGMLLFPAGKFDDGKLAPCILNPSSPACAPIIEDGGCTDVDPQPNVSLTSIATARTEIAAVLAAQTPNGGTPMRFALARAWAHLIATPGPQERAVVLVTDGQPQSFGTNPQLPNLSKACGTLDDLSKDTAAAAEGSPSVRTFVIVLPGDAEPGLMSGLAVRGKTAKPGCTLQNASTQECHTQLSPNDYAATLGPAIAEAIDQASRGCVFTASAQAVASPNATTLVVDGASVPRDPARTEGWEFVAGDPKHLQIYGAACELLRGKQTSEVKLAVGCGL